MQQSIGFQRFEDVTHRRGSAFDRVEIEFTWWSWIPAHSPHQVLMRDAFVVDKHPVRDRVVVPDDGVYKLVNERVWFEPEFLHGECHHFLEEGGAGHIGMLGDPRPETRSDALGLRHSANAGRFIHDALALGNGELAKEEVTLTRGRGYPVWITATGVEECRLRGTRGFLGEFDQLVLDLERAEGFEVTKLQYVHFHLLLLASAKQNNDDHAPDRQ